MFDDHVCGISAVPIPKQCHTLQVSKTRLLFICSWYVMGGGKYFAAPIKTLLINLWQVSASMAAANSFGSVVAIRFLLGFVEAPFL